MTGRYDRALELLEEVAVPPDRDETERLLDRLSRDPVAAAARLFACDTISAALSRLGDLLWVGGSIIGPDRANGSSPLGFGKDAVVGLASVTQIGGELSRGAVDLLKVGNLYAASAIVRQLVEVEYLAYAFASEPEIAAEWLRADRATRLAFWSPSAVRRRADGAFPAADYWGHCDLGGHPTTDGRRLLPDHTAVNVTYLWVDLTGHLVGLWTSARTAAEHEYGAVVGDWELPDVRSAIASWHETDGLREVLGDLKRRPQTE